jgi:hypothetical protein
LIIGAGGFIFRSRRCLVVVHSSVRFR